MEAHLITSDDDVTLNDPELIKPALKPDDIYIETEPKHLEINITQSLGETEVKPSTSSQSRDTLTNKNGQHSDTISSKVSLEINSKDSKNISETASEGENMKLKNKRLMFILNRLNAVLLLIVVPICLLMSIVLKVSFQSIVYLFLLFILPFFYPVNKATISNRLRNFLFILIVVSCLNLFGQLVFQIYLLSNQPYGNPTILPNCSLKQEILEEIGYSRFDTAFIYDILRIVLPDVLVLVISIINLLLCQHLNRYNLLAKRKLSSSQLALTTTAFTDKFCPLANVTVEPLTGILTAQINTHNGSDAHDTTEYASSFNEINQRHGSNKHKKKHSNRKSMLATGISPIKRFLKTYLPFIQHVSFLMLTLVCATMWPSLLSTPYLIFFIFFMTKWSVTKRDTRAGKSDHVIKLFLVFYLAAHILLCYIYQLKLFQLYSPDTSLMSRLFGFNRIVYTECEQPAHFFINTDLKWQQLAYPFALFALYWFITVEFSYVHEKDDKESIFSSPKSPPIPRMPTVAVGRLISDETDTRHSANLKYFETNESILISRESEGEQAAETQHLFHSEENIKKPVQEIPLRKKRTQKISVNSNPSLNESLIALNQERLKIGQLVLNIELLRDFISSTLKFFRKQSYLLSLISMMAWSILYHSVLTLVLLITACLIWVMPSSRKWCLRTSPLVLIYSITLLILEFIYDLQLTPEELPEYEPYGLVKSDAPFFSLNIKVGLMLTFWLTLSQYLTEKRNEVVLSSFVHEESGFRAATSSSILDLASSKRASIKKNVINWIQMFFIKSWILLSSGMLLLMSCQNPVVVYRIGYMLLFLYFIAVFQISYSFWRYSLYVFHSIVVLYSMIVLLLIYIFQFVAIQKYCANQLKIDPLVLSSLGFEKLAKDQLAVRLLTPTLFLIVNIIQIHYFNAPWLKLTDHKLINEPEATNLDTKINQTSTLSINNNNEKPKKEEFITFVIRITNKIASLFNLIVSYQWRIAEIHIYKVIVILTCVYCIHKVTLLNLILFFLVLFGLLVERVACRIEKQVRLVFSCLVLVWVCVMTISSMVYQLDFIKSPLEIMVSNCTFDNSTITPNNTVDPFLLRPEDNLKYIGIVKSPDVKENLQFYILIFVMLAVQQIVKQKCKFTRTRTGQRPPFYSIIFERITWQELDLSIINFFKYIVNFFFYKFGLEICFFMTAIVVIVRMDAYALLYGIWLGVFIRLKRKTVRSVWTTYFVFLLVVLLVQYISCLGLPPIFCFRYPWAESSSHTVNQIRKWMFMPDYSSPPQSYLLVADFFQVYFAWLQLAVFNIELKSSTDNETTESIIINLAGTNEEIIYDPILMKQNPYFDFISNSRHYLDKFKYAIYMYSYWIVLAIVFYTGTSRISILCSGYVLLTFIFFWYGQTFLIKPIEKLIKLWNILVFYCFLVIFTKACLQIFLCLLTNVLDEKSICNLIDLFGVDCRTGNNAAQGCPNAKGEEEDVGLIYDVFCFMILLVQRRIYMSYMFQYVVNEYKAQSTLAARGADIFKNIIQRRVKKEKYKEQKEFKKLKERVERIKMKRLKENQVNSSVEEPDDYYTSIRSGDYYMFESEYDISDTESDETDSEARVKKTKKLFKLKPDNSTNNDQHEQPQKKISFADVGAKSPAKKDDDLPEIDLFPSSDENFDQSWASIRNKTLLKIIYYVKQAFDLLIDFIIELFYKYSKDYRIVSHILSKEKMLLKSEYENSQAPALIGLVNSLDGITEQPPRPSLYQVLEQKDNGKIIQDATTEIENEIKDQTRLDKLLSSLFYFLLSQSEILCYVFLVLNHMMNTTVLSVPLPIAVFLWAMLGVPRPKKSYWITMITYIEAIVLIKYIFQFKIISWNQPSNNASEQNFLKFIIFLGIDRKDSTSQFAIYDLWALLAIFLHRTILKNMGLWRNSNTDDDVLVVKNDDRDEVKSVEAVSGLNDSKRTPNLKSKTDEAPVKSEDEGNTNNEYGNNEESISSPATDYEDFEENETLPIKKRIKKKAKAIKNQRLLSPCFQFYEDLTTKHYAVVEDCYAKMFLCDFINCVVVIFYYQYFGTSADLANTSAINSIKQNKVPISFLMIFLLQFILMIVDRALYLRKNIHLKFFFHVTLVIGYHIWIFFILPIQTGLSFLDNRPSTIWYLVKCIYFGYSSRQIRCGFPKRILGNFVTKSYNYLNLILFKGFLLVPFLLELRSLMDWMFTDTSFSLFDWLQMEDIYSNIFVLKCNRYNEKKYPVPGGQKRNAIIKYGFGGTLLVIIILIIWFPLLLFSFSEGFKRSVPPTTFKVNIQFAGYLPIYSMASQKRLFQQFTQEDFNRLKKASPEEAYGFFKDFKIEDIYCISIPGSSTSLWELSPPSMDNLKAQLQQHVPLQLDFIYELTRESTEENEQLSEVVTAIKSTNITNSTMDEIYKVLSFTEQKSISIKAAYPRFSHVRPKGNIEEIEVLKDKNYYSDVKLTLTNKSNVFWWDVYDDNQFGAYNMPCYKNQHLNMIVFSDPVAPSSISFITEQGIIGIYITLVLAVSRILRFSVVNSSMRIMFEQLPNVEKILRLLKSIYVVRENKNFILEQKLFSKLLFLYRSTEMMIKYTRSPVSPHQDSMNYKAERRKKRQ